MSLRKVNRKTNEKHTMSWDVLIKDADERIAEAKARVAQLELARASFKKKADAGEPYPLGATTQELATRD